MTVIRNHWEGIYQSKEFEACSWYLRLCREATSLWIPFQKRGPFDAAVSISNNTPLKNLHNVLKLILKSSLQKNFSILRLLEVNKSIAFVLIKENN